MTAELIEATRHAADLEGRYEVAREARDRLIRVAYLEGKLQPEIAREAGLSTVMIGKVCRGLPGRPMGRPRGRRAPRRKVNR